MNTNAHDVQEALYQAPGDQVLELGAEIEDLRKLLGARSEASGSLRDEVDQRLAYLASRTHEIAPVVEILHEVAERAQPSGLNEDIEKPTAFIVRQSPPFAAVFLRRLARARAAGDAEKAGELRDLIATYARSSPVKDARELLIDGLRLDAFAHGETRPGYVIQPAEKLRIGRADAPDAHQNQTDQRRRVVYLNGD